MGPSDFMAMHQLLCSSSFSRKAVQPLRAKALQAPTMPSPEHMAVFESVDVQGPQHGPTPEWAKVLCEHRALLHGCALVVGLDEERGQAFAFLYSMQKPQIVVCLPLRPTEVVLPCLSQMAFEELLEESQELFLFDYIFTLGDLWSTRSCPFFRQ